ncbi:MAG: LuxR C-terminal-related transcriptional regulator [Cyanobacteria bacterium P01_E01_bin.6]
MLTTQDSQHTDSFSFSKQQAPPLQPSTDLLLTAVLSSWIDGVLILTEQGQIVHRNEVGRQICDRLYGKAEASGSDIPQELWQICNLLLLRYAREPGKQHVIESEMDLKAPQKIRVRVRRFEFGDCSQPYLLMLLEDQYQSSQNLAIAEVDRYQLSPREAEVWVLRRIGYPLKRISRELCISINTVKKHLKAIREKQQETLSQESLYSQWAMN